MACCYCPGLLSRYLLRGHPSPTCALCLCPGMQSSRTTCRTAQFPSACGRRRSRSSEASSAPASSLFQLSEVALKFNIFSFIVTFSFIIIPQLTVMEKNRLQFTGLEFLTGAVSVPPTWSSCLETQDVSVAPFQASHFVTESTAKVGV